MTKISETETVVKRIVPYLVRRGYDLEKDMTFEYPTVGTARASLGFVDILVRRGTRPGFLVEAKRVARTLNARDREQAIDYGLALKCPFVVLTNGFQFESLNVSTGRRIRWNGESSDKVPSFDELATALAFLKKNPDASDVLISGDSSLPFRPGLTLKQLNVLFARCHGIIRKIEKNEDHAFADFAKILFLRLLEEKADSDGMSLPYSYRFHELAERPPTASDQVMHAINSMLDAVRSKTAYGEVLSGGIRMTRSRTFQEIVRALSEVSFRDSRTDSKGAAFEYFVRATLKGKRLGQYFTPRPLVELMQALVGEDKIVDSLRSGADVRVMDPACGTGGFLVFLMNSALTRVEKLSEAGKLTSNAKAALIERIKQRTFFGADAHEGVASSAKMNMIIAGDGHSNIVCEDTLSRASTIWSVDVASVDVLITNPPFGTAEGGTMSDADRRQFPVGGARGQILFLQKMVLATKPGGDICTVIDEGLLNTEQAAELRRWIMKHTRLRGVVELPEVTFKPNKINVKASVLHLVKREKPNDDLDEAYGVPFVHLETLGYHGSGELVRGQDLPRVITDISEFYHGSSSRSVGMNGGSAEWSWFTRSSLEIASDAGCRFDARYWNPAITAPLEGLKSSRKAKTIKALNLVATRRGRSPPSHVYVDEEDGYALVVKAGSNISRTGEILFEGDFIEKDVYDEMSPSHVEDGDVLLASTGEGTLGKCAVYRGERPAVFDGHVTRIRVDPDIVYPEYLADYLRAGFGADQIGRLFTGSTGLIELTPDAVNQIVVPLPKLTIQEEQSASLRIAELEHRGAVDAALSSLKVARAGFRTAGS